MSEWAEARDRDNVSMVTGLMRLGVSYEEGLKTSADSPLAPMCLQALAGGNASSEVRVRGHLLVLEPFETRFTQRIQQIGTSV